MVKMPGMLGMVMINRGDGMARGLGMFGNDR